MQNVAIDWHVWVLTRSPLALGLVGLDARRADRRLLALGRRRGRPARPAPRDAHHADRHGGRGGRPGVADVLSGATTSAAVYLLTALSAAANAFDNPSRQSLVPRLVPGEDLPGALLVMLTAFQVAAIGGPALAGLADRGRGGHRRRRGARVVAPLGGLSLIYALNSVSFLGVLGRSSVMQVSGETEERRPARVERRGAPEGLRFVFGDADHRLDDGARLLRDVLLGLACRSCRSSRTRVLEIGPSRLRLAARRAGARRARWARCTRRCDRLPRRQGPVLLFVGGGLWGGHGRCSASRAASSLTFAALAASGLADTISTVIRQTRAAAQHARLAPRAG